MSRYIGRICCHRSVFTLHRCCVRSGICLVMWHMSCYVNRVDIYIVRLDISVVWFNM